MSRSVTSCHHDSVSCPGALPVQVLALLANVAEELNNAHAEFEYRMQLKRKGLGW